MAIRIEEAERGDEDEESILSEINITPLVDVFLVLLIIFMVTTSTLSQIDFDVALPKAQESSNPGSNAQGVIVSLKADGALTLNGLPIAAGDWGRFETLLQTAFKTESGASKTVILQGDEKAVLGRAIEVIDRAKRAGATSVSVATQSGP